MGCCRSIGPMCPNGGISAPLRRRDFVKEQNWTQSQYYQEDFLASHSVQPGSDEARKMTVTSGRKCSELYRRSDPLGLLVRTLLVSSVWRSTRCFLTWKVSATPAKRSLFRLVPSMPRTDGTDVPLWVTTPTAYMDHKRSQRFAEGRTPTAVEFVKLFPTPIASDYKNRGCKDSRKNRQGQLQTTIGGSLNPTWVEWLMGFPIGWTDLDASETPSCHSSSAPCSGQSQT